MPDFTLKNETIRILRNLRGYKQSYMSSRMNISQQDYSYLETRGRKISDNQLSLISEILQVDLDFINHFDPSEIFRLMQLTRNKGSITDEILNNISDKDEVIITLKTQIIHLKESVSGLREQNKALNETIKDLKKMLLGKDKMKHENKE